MNKISIVAVLSSFVRCLPTELNYDYFATNEISDERMSVVLYEDRLTEDWKSYALALQTVSAEEDLSSIDFYSVDARTYPDLEDNRLQNSITRYKQPQSSYLIVLHQGRLQVLDFEIANDQDAI